KNFSVHGRGSVENGVGVGSIVVYFLGIVEIAAGVVGETPSQRSRLIPPGGEMVLTIRLGSVASMTWIENCGLTLAYDPCIPLYEIPCPRVGVIAIDCTVGPE